MTTVRGHLKGKTLKEIERKKHEELALTVALYRAVEDSFTDEKIREFALKEFPELEFFPTDGGMV